MMSSALSLFYSLLTLTNISSTSRSVILNSLRPFDSLNQNVTEGDADPLFLTPYINEGKLEEGRNLSRVTNVSELVSYSGYFTVNPTLNSNLFFWFFPAVFNPNTAPLLVWLQGGPGGSSLFGLFVENGPFRIDRKNRLHLRPTAWTLTHSVIYIDNPVGTGFSFTDDDAGYAKNQEDVARDLYSAITQFFTLFPEYAARDFYLTGESYAGKYIPAFAHKIHTENQKSPKVRINLKGAAIGDGWSDPLNMLNFGTYLKNVGLIDEKEMEYFHEKEEEARDAIKKKEWIGAFGIIDDLIGWDSKNSYFKNVTGFTMHYNYLMPHEPADYSYYTNFVQLPSIRRRIHVGNRSYAAESSKVGKFLVEDICQGVVPWIVELLEAPEGYRILLYSGQLDIIVPHISTEQMLDKMNWSGAPEYANADKKFWKVGQDVAGYVRSARNLTYLFVRNAGHILPYDQPKWSWDMINRFTAGKPFA